MIFGEPTFPSMSLLEFASATSSMAADDGTIQKFALLSAVMANTVKVIGRTVLGYTQTLECCVDTFASTLTIVSSSSSTQTPVYHLEAGLAVVEVCCNIWHNALDLLT